MIRFTSGNLFSAQTEPLVNAVNTFGVMGKGIALQFKEKFHLNFKIYQKACKSGDIKIGRLLTTETGLLTGPKYIINFPTKQDWKENTRLSYIHEGLENLVTIIQDKKITSIAIPPLGCGNGGLDWRDVKPVLEQHLATIATKIDIEIYEPGQHGYAKTGLSASTPKLTKARALAIALADRYNVLGFDISHLELQKLMYFLQEFGQTDLALKYTKGKFGLYATNLKHLLAYLEGYFFKGQIRFQDMRPTDSLTLIQDRLPSINEFLDVELSEEEKERLERVANFIEGFESPFGLELLATIWYAMKESRSVDERIIHAYVAAWSDRKSELMSPEYIRIALDRIRPFAARV